MNGLRVVAVIAVESCDSCEGTVWSAEEVAKMEVAAAKSISPADSRTPHYT